MNIEGLDVGGAMDVASFPPGPEPALVPIWGILGSFLVVGFADASSFPKCSAPTLRYGMINKIQPGIS